MPKDLNIMGDPELDRIFTEAYRDTMRNVDVVERDKSVRDRIDAFTELFKRDLYSRDLTPAEREAVVAAFRSYIEGADRRAAEEGAKRRRRFTVLGSYALGAAVIGGLILMAVYRPFTPVSAVEERLQSYYERVDEGAGGFSRKYFRTVDRFDRKLGDARTAELRAKMNAEIDENLMEYIQKVESGEIAYYDDARTWAGYFTEREVRKAKRQIVQNALVKGVGEAMGEATESVIQGAKGLIEKAGELIRERGREILDGEQEEPPAEGESSGDF